MLVPNWRAGMAAAAAAATLPAQDRYDTGIVAPGAAAVGQRAAAILDRPRNPPFFYAYMAWRPCASNRLAWPWAGVSMAAGRLGRRILVAN